MVLKTVPALKACAAVALVQNPLDKLRPTTLPRTLVGKLLPLTVAVAAFPP